MSVSSTSAPVSKDRYARAGESILLHPYVRALGTPVKRRTPSPLYLVALAAVALVMLLLPVLYLCVISAVGYLTWLHATRDAWIITEVHGARGSTIVGILYVGGIVAGLVGMFFMVKPLFARRSNPYAPLSLNQKDEPLLFAFVDRLCEVVGSPKPSRIDIDLDMNASAGFKGFFSGLLGGQLVLTLGLPLVASLTLNQLTGVLAHEFGHFAQRGGMRLTYLIRQINGWFARVVYERDAWDDMLSNAATNGGYWAIQLIAMLAQLFVWVGRRVLWVLMMFGHLVSSIMLRQMEFDADRYSGLVVGSNEAQGMLRALPALDVASAVTYQELGQGLRDKQLPADLPSLIAKRVANLSDDVRQKLHEASLKNKTGWFDSHPSGADRAAALQRRADAGVFDVDASASGLLRDFPTCSRLMTRERYREVLGKRFDDSMLVDLKVVEKNDERAGEADKAITTSTAGLLGALRPVFLPNQPIPPDGDSIVEALLEARSAVSGLAVEELKHQAENWKHADKQFVLVNSIKAALEAGVTRVDAKAAGLVSLEDRVVRGKLSQSAAIREGARRQLEDALVAPMRRLELAMAYRAAVQDKSAQPVEVATDEVDGVYDLIDVPIDLDADLLRAMRAFSSVASEVEVVRQQYGVIEYLLQFAQGKSQVTNQFAQTVLSRVKQMNKALASVKWSLGPTPWPFDAGSTRRTLSEYVVPDAPVPDQVGQNMQAADTALGTYYRSYVRLVGELCARAEDVEAELGLAPLGS